MENKGLFALVRMNEGKEILESDSMAHQCHEICKPISSVFPSLLGTLYNARAYILSIHTDEENKIIESNRQKVVWTRIYSEMARAECEIMQECGAEWTELSSNDNNYFCRHTFAALTALLVDKDYERMDLHDRNLLLWALLFHDIAKKGSPTIYGRDPFHPFSSTSKTLEIFVRFGWVKSGPHIAALVELINSAYTLENGSKLMDNSKLPEIFQGILQATELNFSTTSAHEPRFAFEVLILILFHQSLDINPIFPNPVYLKNSEILTYLSPRLVFLLFVLHKADHNSYNLAYPISSWHNNELILQKTFEILSLFS